MEQQLLSISNIQQKDKSSAYSELLTSTINGSNNSLVDNLGLILDSILNESQIIARTSLNDLVNKLTLIEDVSTRKEVMAMSLIKLQPRLNSFEEQVCNLRMEYAQLLEEDEEFSESAKVLIGIPLESGNRSTEFKLGIYIRIVRCFLEEEDSTSAETYFNRATLLAHTTVDMTTQLQFKLCQARMFDFSRRFAEASSKYHELSYNSNIAEEERIFCLSSAITCAVLAPAGPNRSRILSSLYRDERSLQTSHHTILSKMFLDQMIRPTEVSEFASTLKPHQMAQLPPVQSIIISEDSPDEVGLKGPENILDRAVMEHNVLACSRIFNNITFKGLGLLLNLRPSAAEAMTRIMITQKRLRGTIDQSEGLILFDPDSKEGVDGIVSNVVAAAATATDSLGEEGMEEEEVGTAPATKRMDHQLRLTLNLIESIAMRCEVLLNRGKLEVAKDVVEKVEVVEEERKDEEMVVA